MQKFFAAGESILVAHEIGRDTSPTCPLRTARRAVPTSGFSNHAGEMNSNQSGRSKNKCLMSKC